MQRTAHHERVALAVVIIVIALAVLYIFYTYQNFLTDLNAVPRFVALASVALGLLLVLFYMVSQRADKHISSHRSVAKKSTKKRRR